MTSSVARIEFDPVTKQEVPHARRWQTGIAEIWALICEHSSALAICVIITFLWFELFVFPAVSVFLSNDQAINLDNAARMLRGETIYGDFFQYTLPGAELFYLLWFAVFGVREWIPNVGLVLTGTVTAWLGMVIARRLLSGWHAVIPALLFVYAFHFILDGTHHKFSVLFAIAGCAVLMERQDLRRILLTGVLLGISACFTQTRGATVLGGLGLFLFWQGWISGSGVRSLAGRIATLIAGFAVVIVPIFWWYAARVGVASLVDQTVIFPLRYYRADAVYNTWSAVSYFSPRLPQAAEFAWEVVIYALVPGIYLVSLAYLWVKNAEIDDQTRNRLALLSLVGLSLYGSVTYAPLFVRLCEISLPAFILACWFLEIPLGSSERTFVVIALVAVLSLAGTALRTQTRWHGIVNTPGGRAALLDLGEYRRVEALAASTVPGDFFFEALYCDLYFALGLRNPSPVPYVTANDYTRPEQVETTVQALERTRTRLVLWSTKLDHGGTTDHLAPLRMYLQYHYRLIDDLGGQWILLERSR